MDGRHESDSLCVHHIQVFYFNIKYYIVVIARAVIIIESIALIDCKKLMRFPVIDGFHFPIFDRYYLLLHPQYYETFLSTLKIAQFQFI